MYVDGLLAVYLFVLCIIDHIQRYCLGKKVSKIRPAGISFLLLVGRYADFAMQIRSEIYTFACHVTVAFYPFVASRPQRQ